MQLQVLMQDQKTTSNLDVADAVFANPYNEGLIHQVVTAHLAGGRAGTKAQKSRSEVRGGGTKPWRQKGTGRARAGTIRSPLWRSGGVTFAAKPRSYAQKVNRKMYRAALRSIVSELVKQQRLIVVEELSLAEPKTKLLAAQLKTLDVSNVLLVTDQIDSNLTLAARNLPHVADCVVSEINPVNLISYEKIVISKAALQKLEETLS